MNTASNAANNPASITPDLAHTGDMPVGQQLAQDFDIPPLGEPIIREPEAVEPVAAPLTKNDFDEIMFMEELMQIRIEPLQEKNPRKIVDVYVNGVAEWIPVGRPWILRRKFVEVLARAKPISVQTQHEGIGEGEDGMPNNRIIRNTSSMFPFSVLQDSQRGIEWLNRLMAEG